MYDQWIIGAICFGYFIVFGLGYFVRGVENDSARQPDDTEQRVGNPL
ncbi:hypothetical protein [Tardiphaga sp. 367_B4_N1_1]